MKQKSDLRIIKTEINIKNTFIQLLHEKDYESITIQNILDKALINRTTFYKHYSNKYELTEIIANDFLAEFKSLADIRFSNKDDLNGLLENLDKVYEQFYARRMTINGLWKIHVKNVNVYEDMQTILKEKYIMFAKKHAKENWNINFQACIFASLVMTTLKFMLENQKFYTAHEVIAEIMNYFNIISTKSIKSNEEIIR